MKKTFITILLLHTLLITYSQQQISPQADSLYNKMMAVARPSVKNWVTSTAAKYKDRDLTQEQVIAEAKQTNTALGNLNDGDIEALAFLVLMQAAKSAQEDLKGVMGQIKSMNNNKAAQRQQSNMLKKSSASINTTVKPEYSRVDSLNPSKTNLALKTVDMRNKKDNMSEMSAEQQLKMQMAMERRSKMNEAISNLMKKIAETQDQIIQNLK